MGYRQYFYKLSNDLIEKIRHCKTEAEFVGLIKEEEPNAVEEYGEETYVPLYNYGIGGNVMAEYIERGGDRFPTSFRSEEKGDYRQGWNHCLRAIYQIPAADVAEVKHGHWHNVYMSSASSFVGTCSVCGISNDIPPVPLAKYCPNCGAKMDGGQDDG